MNTTSEGGVVGCKVGVEKGIVLGCAPKVEEIVGNGNVLCVEDGSCDIVGAPEWIGARELVGSMLL